MIRKGLLVLALATLVAGGVFAQDDSAKTKLWLSGELSVLGAGLRGEYMLSDNLSISLNAYWTTLILFSDVGAAVVARFYPWAGNFYAGLGAGYGVHLGLSGSNEDLYSTETSGFSVLPEIGWRIDVGARGGFFLNPLVQVPLILGNKVVYDNQGFGFGVGFRAALGLGYTF